MSRQELDFAWIRSRLGWCLEHVRRRAVDEFGTEVPVPAETVIVQVSLQLRDAVRRVV